MRFRILTVLFIIRSILLSVDFTIYNYQLYRAVLRIALNLSISVSAGKERNIDIFSSGERKRFRLKVAHSCLIC